MPIIPVEPSNYLDRAARGAELLRKHRQRGDSPHTASDVDVLADVLTDLLCFQSEVEFSKALYRAAQNHNVMTPGARIGHSR